MLIESHLKSEIDDITFCNEFYYSYNLEINTNTLTNIEKLAFSELDKVVSRFSEFEEDHNLDPNAFATKEELNKKIKETYESLHQLTTKQQKYITIYIFYTIVYLKDK